VLRLGKKLLWLILPCACKLLSRVKGARPEFILYLMVRDERPLLWVVFEYYNCFRIRIVVRIGINSIGFGSLI